MNDLPSLPPDRFKAVMATFAAGVTVVTTVDESGGLWGLTATAFTSVSLVPPLCLVCINRGTASYEPLKRAGKFAVSVLSDEQEHLSNRFATRLPDKFEGVAWQPSPALGCPVLTDALAWMECVVTAVHPAGDHDLFVGELKGSHVTEGQPLVYWRGAYGDVTSRPKAW